MKKFIALIIFGMFFLSLIFISAGVWDNVVSYYNLDDDGSPVVDNVNGVNNGTNNGATTGLNGIINDAYNFTNANSDHISIPHSTSLNFVSAEDYTLQAWFKFPDEAYRQYIFIKRGTDGSPGTTIPVELFMETDGTLLFLIGDGSNYPTAISPLTYDDNKWHHVVITKNVALDEIVLYVDGNVTDSETDTTSTEISNTEELTIGGRLISGDEKYANGLIDEIAIWRGVTINNASITDLFNEGAASPLAAVNVTVTLNTPTDEYLFS